MELFLDHAYVCKPVDFQFVDGIFELCRTAKQLGYLIFVITNQAGIGRGYYTEQDFIKLSDWMCGVFKVQGVDIDKVYFCPSHPEYGIGQYKVDSPYRKPGPGMICRLWMSLVLTLRDRFWWVIRRRTYKLGLLPGWPVIFCIYRHY